MEFDEPITTVDELRSIIAPPGDIVLAKEVSQLDEYCRDFISRSPFIVIASTDGNGVLDTSPKGDPAGFVRVLDSTTLAIPERPGNHRADTLVNIVQHPYVGIIFLIPGTRNTLRIRGKAQLVRDSSLLDSLAHKGKAPELAIIVEVTTAYFHCAKSIIRSRLWSAEQEASTGNQDELLLAETMVKHGNLDLTVDQMQAIILGDEIERLY